jgi:GNAT superfamily N-acetyltransferase
MIRKLIASEWATVRDHLLRLGTEDRRARFFCAVGDDAIAAYSEKIFADNGIVLGCFVGGVLRGVGELRQHGALWNSGAEIAITVERPFQCGGIGTALLKRLIELARNRSIRTIHFLCLLDNAGARKIARNAGATPRCIDGAVTGDIIQPWPSFWSLFSEAFADGQAVLHGWFGDPVEAPADGLGARL